MIVKKHGRWLLLTRDGLRVIAVHATRRAAKAQEIAIQLAKARRAGHRIPRKRGKR